MNLSELVQQFPPMGPLLEITGTPDLSNFFQRWLNTYPSVKQLFEMISSGQILPR